MGGESTPAAFGRNHQRAARGLSLDTVINLGAVFLLLLGLVLLLASSGHALSVPGGLTVTGVFAVLLLMLFVLVAAILLAVANLLDSLNTLPPTGRAERAREEKVHDEFLRAEGDLAIRSR